MDITPEMSQAIGASLLELQKLITCPLCSQLMDDPATLTCGHLFCYKCINSGIEYGVMVAKKGHPEDHIIDNSNNGRNKKKKVNKPKKIQFACPICETAAFKWTILRLPQLKNLIHEITEIR
eukprot:Tbor_TRINITY_DN5649_c0_g3::TRINITY_DN5649_c0_g3_i2::g.8369::m.8369